MMNDIEAMKTTKTYSDVNKLIIKIIFIIWGKTIEAEYYVDLDDNIINRFQISDKELMEISINKYGVLEKITININNPILNNRNMEMFSNIVDKLLLHGEIFNVLEFNDEELTLWVKMSN